ncbi:hypothetical protein ACFL47_02035 [Candidatus Latescibacterota bacterium]
MFAPGTDKGEYDDPAPQAFERYFFPIAVGKDEVFGTSSDQLMSSGCGKPMAAKTADSLRLGVVPDPHQHRHGQQKYPGRSSHVSLPD